MPFWLAKKMETYWERYRRLCQDACAGARKFLVIGNVVVDERSRGKGAGTGADGNAEACSGGRIHYAILFPAERRAGHAFYRALGFQEEKGPKVF